MAHYMSNGRALTEELADECAEQGLPQNQWARTATMILCIDWFWLTEVLAHGRLRSDNRRGLTDKGFLRADICR